MDTDDVDLSESLRELRRRADELAVLNDLARRLAALHDTREVLDEVARQARRLLGVDVAYIMVLVEDRLRIEVVDGSMGSGLRGIELRSGEGLGGQVLRTGRPLWSERYVGDTRFPHPEGVDAAATSEQLGGILGVPLVAGEDTLGVLLAAERRARAFSDHEVALLAGLAAHAALALRTADLFDRERAAATELRAANDALQVVNDRRQKAGDLRDRLNEVVIRGGGLDAVVAALERSVGVVLEVRDPDGRTLAGTAPSSASDSTRLEHLVPVDLPSGHAADLVAAGGETLDEEGLRLLQIGASAVAVLLASERSVAEAELRSRGEFVHALLTAGTDAPSLGRRARALGIDLRSVRTVAVLEPGAGDPAAAARFGAHVTTAHRGWSASHAGGIVLLLPEAVDVVRESVRRRAAADGEAPTTGLAPVTQAGSDGHRGADAPDGIRQGYEHARQTAAVLLALDRAGTCATSEELGFYRSLFSRAGRAELAAFIRLTIGPLLDYDAAHQRDLAATLEVYLEQSRHHARTCQVMHIHSNTLYQRLDRVTEVLGPGWKDPGTALEVQVALRLGRLLSTWGDRA